MNHVGVRENVGPYGHSNSRETGAARIQDMHEGDRSSDMVVVYIDSGSTVESESESELE